MLQLVRLPWVGGLIVVPKVRLVEVGVQVWHDGVLLVGEGVQLLGGWVSPQNTLTIGRNFR
jgi:hypothetical protein